VRLTPPRHQRDGAAILVGGTTDSYLDSVLDEKNHLTGFAVEVVDAVARKANLANEHLLGTGAEMADGFLTEGIRVHRHFTKCQSRVIKSMASIPFPWAVSK
jgi:ABC-type amino acid transport substrate-binding protein